MAGAQFAVTTVKLPSGRFRAVLKGACCRSSGALAEGREAGSPLSVTASGHVLHATAVKRTLDWRDVARGRRIHDLRHTAACLWLARGVDPGTVQAWMGRESIATTNRYLHFLGTGADLAGLDRLNATPGGTRGARKGVSSE